MFENPIYPHEDVSGELLQQQPLGSCEKELVGVLYERALQNRGFLAERAEKLKEKALKMPLGYGRALTVSDDPALTCLRDKHQFVSMLSELGYRVPSEFLLRKGKEPDYEALESFLEGLPAQGVLVKPKNGHQGKGISRHKATRLARELNYRFFSNEGKSKKDLLVQEEAPITTDYRYMGYKTTEGKSYRVAYEKVSPAVISNGKSLVRQVFFNRDWQRPLEEFKTDNFYDRNCHRYGMFRKIPEGTKIPLISSGNVHQGAEPRFIDDDRLGKVDRFMNKLLADIETVLQQPLNYFCFDVGVIDENALDADYDFESIRAALCFFEFQQVCGISSYGKLLKEAGIDPQFYKGFQRLCARDSVKRVLHANASTTPE